MRVILLLVLIVMTGADPAWAYVGPGLGLGAIGTFLGVVLAVLLGILGFFWYPIKRLLRRMRGIKDPEQESER